MIKWALQAPLGGNLWTASAMLQFASPVQGNTMKLKFKIQPFQTAAVNAVADCFAGQMPNGGLAYSIDPGQLAFHAVNGGSNPPGDAKNFNRLQQLSF